MVDSLSGAWNDVASRWIAWARKPGHDSYWIFHRSRFFELTPEPGRLTIDVGCGEGRVGRDLAARGHRVVGVDSSPVLVRACVEHPEGHPAVVGDAVRLPFPTDIADRVIGFMSFHDLDDLEAAIAEVARVLAPGGRVHLAIVHPFNSAGTWSAVNEGDGGELPAFVIEGSYLKTYRYADEVETDGLTMTFHGRHRPLSQYTRALAESGFVIETLEEVTDPDSEERWSRMPLFLHIIARLL